MAKGQPHITIGVDVVTFVCRYCPPSPVLRGNAPQPSTACIPFTALREPVDSAPSTCWTCFEKMQKGIGRFPYTRRLAMNGASKAGHVAAIVWASQFGHIGFGHHVRRAFLRAAAKGNVQVLQWWQNNLSSDELQSMMKFIPKAAVFASQFRRIHVLEWLKTKGLLEFGPHVKSALGRAGKNGYTDVLQWWKENLSDEELQSIHLNVNNVSCHGHASSLQVLKESGVTFVYKRYAMDSASGNGHPDVLQWWKDSKLELRYTADAIDSASDLGLIEVLQWWKDSGLELKYTTKALLNPCKNRNLEMLNWWINSGLELPYDAVTLRAALDAGLVTVVHRWWELSRGEDNVRPDYKDALPLWQDWIQTVLPADDASCRSYSNSDGTASDNESDDNASDDSGSATTSEGSDWRTYCYDLV
ncbi:hypothetical protein DFJ73DRAFT_881829 [Zopfochytrium polystomum]|nr:hypothetical protein DFJ73DRAFT_881829 [Zopfochytrium polystomum]